MLFRLSLFILVSVLPLSAQAELEWGLGLGYVKVPDYLGSDESEELVLPFPYFRYRSEKLNIDRNAIQGNLWRAGNWNLELSFGGALPVDSSDNDAREGMDDLDAVVEAGPALHYYWLGDRMSDNALLLILPLRAAFSTDLRSVERRGYTFTPTLRWRRSYQWDSLPRIKEVRPQLSLRVRSANNDYHDYFYGVDQEDVRTNRPEYQSDGGYGGWSLTYSTSVLFDDYLATAFFNFAHIDGAAFDDSPLVRRKNNLSLGLAFAYLF